MSVAETQFKKIDDIEYACAMMPALLSNATLARLVSIVGRPSLVLAAGAVKAKDTDKLNEMYSNLVEIGVNQVFNELSPEQSNVVMLSLMSGVRFKGCPEGKDLSDKDLFDSHFRGRLMSAYNVWVWALQCNYKDFFDFARSANTISRLRAVGIKVLSGLTSMKSSDESVAQTEESMENSTTD